MVADTDKEGTEVIYVVVALLAMIALAVFGYKKFKEPIHRALLVPAKWELSVMASDLGDQRAALILERLEQRPPGTLRLATIVAVYAHVGKTTRWPVAFVLLCMVAVYWFVLARIERFRTAYNLKNLIGHNAKLFPCIVPVLEEDLLSQDPDKGPWRTARSPIQFAVENGLLLWKGKPATAELVIGKDGMGNPNSPVLKDPKQAKLDVKKSAKVFTGQLGKKFNGPYQLPNHQRGLAAAFMAFGHGNRDEAQSLLDQMSLSFDKNRGVDIDGADELIEKYRNSEDFLVATSGHDVYVNTWFQALLQFAQSKGVLPSSQFIWLRPYDRTLWYVLNHVGGRCSWVEASGPWSHFQSEEILEEKIAEPQVEMAVHALEGILIEEGWIAKAPPVMHQRRPKPVSRGRAAIRKGGTS